MRKMGLIVIGAVLVLCVSGCAVPGKATGGGFMTSQGCLTNGDDGFVVNGEEDCGKANFGFNADSCDGEVSGRFNFHDKNAPAWADDGGVKMNGVVVDVVECVAPADGLTVQCIFCKKFRNEDGYGAPVYSVEVAYRSTNPSFRGEGRAYACFSDNGEGFNATSDVAVLWVKNGPYEDYFNYGEVQGNIQGHVCD